MTRLTKEQEAYRQGMLHGLEVARKEGLEELEKEVNLRGITAVPMTVSKSALNKCIENIANQTMDTFLVLTVHTLNDEFGFGQKRCKRFADRFMAKTNCLCDGYVTWGDITESLKQEMNLDLDIRFNDENVRI